MTDNEIINLYWERKEEAITVTAKAYGSYCRTIAYNILHSNEDADKCVNDTWLRAWKSMPPQRPHCLSSYLGKITRNLSIDRFRRNTAEKRGLGQGELVLSELGECVPAAATVEQTVEEQELIEALNCFLYAQSEKRRNIFIRRYWYLFPVKAIADSYGMSERSVISLLFRMRSELKAHLESEGITL